MEAVRRYAGHLWAGDALMLAIAAGYGIVLLAWPSALLIAVGVWWTSNTIAHNFIHRPFFDTRAANRAFGLYLTVLLGIPQSIWRDRHLAHHAGRAPRVGWTTELAIEIGAVVVLWAAIVVRAPAFFAGVYLPGYAAGLILCALHGHYEHEHGTTSHYGRVYNVLLFNDGYHVEHHARPGVHWSRLPQLRDATARRSRWPSPLRWLDAWSLEGLERLVLRVPVLQRLVVESHARAFQAVLAQSSPTIRSVAIVGGGLFPRTAIVLRRLCPSARLTVIDANLENLDRARGLLDDPNVAFRHARYTAETGDDFDLVVFPLSYIGDRSAIYTAPPVPLVIVHDWIWRARGVSRIVSIFLFKRVNMVRGRG